MLVLYPYIHLEYLILENVISRYHCPSILDLKMGTQIHSDSKTSEEEMKRRRSKWEKTTARTLGVRLGGMKVSVIFLDFGLCVHFYLNVEFCYTVGISC